MSKTPYFDKVQERYAIPETPNLRDQSAMAAVAGRAGYINVKMLSEMAYMLADAMIRAREAK